MGQGDSLLLVGHNGSGKSSIFRCLGGLWKIPEGGTITKVMTTPPGTPVPRPPLASPARPAGACHRLPPS